MRLVIFRGLPGSGKSTAARTLYEETINKGLTAVICSADSFMIDEQGQYAFDPNNLKRCHSSCFELARASINANIDVVIIDNTNVCRWEYQHYVRLGKQAGYVVEVVEVGNKFDLELYAHRNQHSVPIATLQKMAARWED